MTATNLTDFPVELHHEIFGYLDNFSDIRSCRLVCRSFNNSLDNEFVVKSDAFHAACTDGSAEQIKKIAFLFNSFKEDQSKFLNEAGYFCRHFLIKATNAGLQSLMACLDEQAKENLYAASLQLLEEAPFSIDESAKIDDRIMQIFFQYNLYAKQSLLIVGQTDLTNDKVRRFIRDFPSLKSVRLEGTGVTGPIVNELKNLTQLEELYLSYIAIDEGELHVLSEMSNLKKLTITRNPKLFDSSFEVLKKLENTKVFFQELDTVSIYQYQ